jgi:misacylated tRNA(Ala) deacylase
VTKRLYWIDDRCFETDAIVTGVRDGALSFDQTCFYPGGGGQPPDEGTVSFDGGPTLKVSDATSDLWYTTEPPPGPELLGQRVRLTMNRERRAALTRHHTVLHVLNTIALRDHSAWITGVQIGPDYSRIDFKWDGFSPALCADLEKKVNSIIEANLPIDSYYVKEDEFHRREDLLRTLDVKPPVIDGQVRVVEIAGFDAQACGGTHVASTAEVGRFSIYKTENKGKVNKRLYIRLSCLPSESKFDG